jgi:enoyl-CoA hydratase/carnithine racemase
MKEQIYAAQTESIETSIATAAEEMKLSFDSEDFKEGVAHYIEKRDPKFSGK